MKTKAEKMAGWVIWISILHPVMIILLFLSGDMINYSVGSILLDALVYLVIPIFIIIWILSIWSLRVSKTASGYIALFLSVLYSLSVIGIVYAFKDFCVIC